MLTFGCWSVEWWSVYTANRLYIGTHARTVLPGDGRVPQKRVAKTTRIQSSTTNRYIVSSRSSRIKWQNLEYYCVRVASFGSRNNFFFFYHTLYNVYSIMIFGRSAIRGTKRWKVYGLCTGIFIPSEYAVFFFQTFLLREKQTDGFFVRLQYYRQFPRRTNRAILRSID